MKDNYIRSEKTAPGLSEAREKWLYYTMSDEERRAEGRQEGVLNKQKEIDTNMKKTRFGHPAHIAGYGLAFRSNRAVVEKVTHICK